MAHRHTHGLSIALSEGMEVILPAAEDSLIFGADSSAPADTVLQNNLTLLEWVERNKQHPDFFGRSINKGGALTEKELDYLHANGCRIALIYLPITACRAEVQGIVDGEGAASAAKLLGIPEQCTLFARVAHCEAVTAEYMSGFILTLESAGYTAGFLANTDAHTCFDREFSRGLLHSRPIFEKAVLWASEPSLEQYYRTETSHFIHPDAYAPFAPSGIRPNDTAVWQYGRECHPIGDRLGNECTFNTNLIRNVSIMNKCFY